MHIEQRLIAHHKLSEPILQLQKEHEAILLKGALMATTLKRIKPKTNGERLRESVSLIKQLRSFLGEHESKEEQILGPIIQELLGPEASATVKKEHMQIGELLQRLEETLLEVNAGMSPRTRQNMIDLTAQFDSSVRAHFSREENVLFWLASLHISKPEAIARRAH